MAVTEGFFCVLLVDFICYAAYCTFKKSIKNEKAWRGSVTHLHDTQIEGEDQDVVEPHVKNIRYSRCVHLWQYDPLKDFFLKTWLAIQYAEPPFLQQDYLFTWLNLLISQRQIQVNVAHWWKLE